MMLSWDTLFRSVPCYVIWPPALSEFRSDATKSLKSFNPVSQSIPWHIWWRWQRWRQFIIITIDPFNNSFNSISTNQIRSDNTIRFIFVLLNSRFTNYYVKNVVISGSRGSNISTGNSTITTIVSPSKPESWVIITHHESSWTIVNHHEYNDQWPSSASWSQS